jgi:hypothetical protein
MLLALFLACSLASVKESLGLMVEIRGTEGPNTIGGWGTPIHAGNTMVTVAHLVGDGVVKWEGQGRHGTATLLYRYAKGDVALFTLDNEPSLTPVQLAKALPDEMSEVYWRLYLPGGIGKSVHAAYVGIDADGDMDIDGTVWPGSSGSGLINECGELVGVVKLNFVPKAPEMHAMVRAMGSATPAIGTIVRK